MSMCVAYRVVRAPTPEKLECLVNDLIAIDGFKPVGRAFVALGWYFQTMVRED